MMNQLNIDGLIATLPIVQGGMGIGVSLSGLASAVANQGGIGVISAVAIGMTDPDYKNNLRQSNLIALRKEIQRAKSLTDGIIGVNIMMAVTDFEQLLTASLEEHVDIVFVGAGLPIGSIFEKFKDTKTKFAPIVSSARAARLIFQHWSDKLGRVPDALVIEGPLAGGHLGYAKIDVVHPVNNLVTLIRILEETLPVIHEFEKQYNREIPIIAGGGVYSGGDIFDILKAGAKGVQMGTRFITTTECDVSDTFKYQFINSNEDSITIIDSPVGLPGRVISNDFVKDIQAGNQKPIKCGWKCMSKCDYKKVQFCVAEALLNATRGDFSKGFAFSGMNGYKATEIISVKETMDQIKQEFEKFEVRRSRLNVKR
jgi:NAD(P)H-dependent flavin oxidoreductase YrpB (nitropropane dioxygenase family)